MSRSVKLLRLIALVAIAAPAIQVLRTATSFAYSSGSEGRSSVTVKVATSNQVPGKGSGEIPPVDDQWTSLCSLNPQTSTQIGTSAESWYQLACSAYKASNEVFALLAHLGTSASSMAATPLQEAESAESTLTLPDPLINTNPSRTTVVNLATWLWIDQNIWHVWTATASAGVMSATAIADPSYVTYALGNGANLRCNGPGTPYDLTEPLDSQHSDCTYTYPTTSIGGSTSLEDQGNPYYVVTASITWKVSWVSTQRGGGGSLPTLTTSSSIDLQVEQIQSVDEQ